MCPRSVLFIFLALSIAIALFNRDKTDIYVCLIVSNLLALLSGVMTIYAAGFMLILAALTLSYYKTKSKILFLLTSTMLGAFVLHDIPGFAEVTSIENITLSALSTTCNIYFNYDKIMAAFIVYALGPLVQAEKPIDFKATKQTFVLTLLCIVTVLLPALLSGYLHFDPKIPVIIIVWSIGNFLFVCFSEEVIFRGFLQNGLSKYALPISSILFGLSHYKNGIALIILASIAGLFYGYAYQSTKRILCAMLVHFGLNLCHLLLLTYPAAI